MFVLGELFSELFRRISSSLWQTLSFGGLRMTRVSDGCSECSQRNSGSPSTFAAGLARRCGSDSRITVPRLAFAHDARALQDAPFHGFAKLALTRMMPAGYDFTVRMRVGIALK